EAGEESWIAPKAMRSQGHCLGSKKAPTSPDVSHPLG
ncbi:hypothetical protein A2U01_0067397, partial [Trifolium medium]|nr:hypothetical protein [Trifolium medium]